MSACTKKMVFSRNPIHIIQKTCQAKSSVPIKNTENNSTIRYNRTRGYCAISVRMLKLSIPSIVKPLTIMFQNYLKSGIFPDDWRKGNIAPVHTHKKEIISQ